MTTCLPALRSTQMRWQGCRSSRRKVSYKLRSGIDSMKVQLPFRAHHGGGADIEKEEVHTHSPRQIAGKTKKREEMRGRESYESYTTSCYRCRKTFNC